MSKVVTAKLFQSSIDQQQFPEQDIKSAKRLVNEVGEFCFASVHRLKRCFIPAIYLRLEGKAAKWAIQKNGLPHTPDFKFNAMTSKGGAVGIECLLAFPGSRIVHLFLDPTETTVQKYLSQLAKGEIVGFSFFVPGAKMVYASYVSNDPQMQDWAKRNLVRAKSCPPGNDLNSVVEARKNMFWLKRKRAFVVGR